MSAPDDLRERTRASVRMLLSRIVLVDGIMLAAAWFLARRLGPEEFGLYATATGIAVLVVPLTLSGFAYAFVRDGHTRAESGTVVWSLVAVLSALGVLVAAIGFVAGAGATALGVGCYAALAPFRLEGTIRQMRDMRFGRFVLVQVSDTVMMGVAVCVLVGAGAGLDWLGALIAAAGIAGALLLSDGMPARPEPTLLAGIWRRTRHDISQFGADTLVTAATVPVLALMFGAETAGVVRWGLLIASPVLMVIGLLGPAIFGALTRAEPAPALIVRGAVLAAVAPLLYTAAIVPALPWLAPLAFGDAWRGFAPVAMVLVVSSALIALAGFVRLAIFAQHADATAWRVRLATWVGSLLLAVPGAIVAGINGVAVALLAGNGAWLLWLLMRASRRGLSDLAPTLTRALVIVVPCVLMGLAAGTVPAVPAVASVTALVVGALSFGALIIAFHRRDIHWAVVLVGRRAHPLSPPSP